MARLSKAHQQVVGDGVEEDAASNIEGNWSSKTHSLEKKAILQRADSAYSQNHELVRSAQTDERSGQDDPEDLEATLQADLDNADDERRESTFTSTSISTLPESNFDTDYEHGAMHTPYTPPMIRPSFRRPESVKKMQMSSPAPSERSLRRSLLSPTRARTPKSGRSSAKGGPGRKGWSTTEEIGVDKKDYPLVLLHVTLLPINVPWSQRSMEDILPSGTTDSLRLLRSKLSENIIQRGILIPHPSGDYELLEERLLEALELKQERITKCGHFRARLSTGSTESTDSGLASSVEGIEETSACETCHRHLKPINEAVRAEGRKWTIKVFAANGLMRASAWSAAWTEMERVDVEILPWIDDNLRTLLDARLLEEAAEEDARQQEEARRVSEQEQEFRQRQQALTSGHELQTLGHSMSPPARMLKDHLSCDTAKPTASKTDELPQVYQPKDIPLSLLLKNYIYLLAQDRRNVLLFALTIVSMAVTLRGFVMPMPDLPVPQPVCDDTSSSPTFVQDFSVMQSTASVPTRSSTVLAGPLVEQTPINAEPWAPVTEEVASTPQPSQESRSPAESEPHPVRSDDSQIHHGADQLAIDRDLDVQEGLVDVISVEIDSGYCANTASAAVLFLNGVEEVSRA